MSRSLSCLPISRAAARLAVRMVFSWSFFPVNRPVFTSIAVNASVWSMTM